MLRPALICSSKYMALGTIAGLAYRTALNPAVFSCRGGSPIRVPTVQLQLALVE